MEFRFQGANVDGLATFTLRTAYDDLSHMNAKDRDREKSARFKPQVYCLGADFEMQEPAGIIVPSLAPE
jgi:hypothetical protein